MISVIMPTYNRSSTLERAINSILNQSYSDIELIIIDDCSTDNTDDIIKKYNDKRIKYYKLKENKGACYARNYGIQKSSGEYIAFQDSDDEWDKFKLQFQLDNMNKNNSCIDFCDYKKCINGMYDFFPNIKTKKIIRKYGIEKALRFGNFVSTQLILAKRECFDKIKFDENLPRLQDFDLILRMSSKFKISYTEKPLATLYLQNDSISNSQAKLVDAVSKMMNKKYSYNSILFSNLYCLVAKNCKNKNEKKKYYLMALKERFSFKIFIKLILKY